MLGRELSVKCQACFYGADTLGCLASSVKLDFTELGSLV
uniref:Uncharacterized protein n=1 Tax=Anguilla anguilla TaxID=7936 RepID=A0A0E9W458_ANGAN